MKERYYVSLMFRYRLKPEPKIVPYGPEDAAFLVGRKFLNKMSGSVELILGVCAGGVFVHDGLYEFEDTLDFGLDVTDGLPGVPFGKRVDES